MKYVRLGHSASLVSAIGQGSDIGHLSTKEYEFNIRYGIDLGMTFIDTAEIYGKGKSERIIGEAIKGLSRQDVFIGTKVLSENLRYKDVIRSAENSLRRLKTDYIDLYQIHWPNNQIDIFETLAAFEDLYDQGKIKFVGVSNFLPMEIEASEHRKCSFGGFVSSQMEYSLSDRFAEEYSMPYCRQHNLSVICYCPLDRGKLCSPEHTKLLDGISEKYEKTPSQIALNWLTSDGNIVIPFSKNLTHIKQNCGAVNFQMEIEDIELIRREFSAKIIHCYSKDIKVSPRDIYFSHAVNRVYTTVEEAINNEFKFNPSPRDLASFFLSLSKENLSCIKPIKAIKFNKEGYKYELVEGRIRYWGWVLAFGDDAKVPLLEVEMESEK